MTELEPTIVKKYKYYSLEYLLHYLLYYLNEEFNENSKEYLKNLEKIDSHSREYLNLKYINRDLYHLSRKIKEKKRMVEKAIEKVKKLELQYIKIEETEQIENIIKRIQNGEYIIKNILKIIK